MKRYQSPKSYPLDYFLFTERLGFRFWREEDLELAFGLWGDNAVTRLIDAQGQLSRAQVQEKLSGEIETAEQFGVQYWPIFLLVSGDHVGCCGLRPYDLEAGIYELGFHIRSALWGRGYASEAARGVIAFAFNELNFDWLNVQALFAGHNPRNQASGRLLKKLGFRYTHDEYYEPTGLDHPSYLLTAQEVLST